MGSKAPDDTIHKALGFYFSHHIFPPYFSDLPTSEPIQKLLLLSVKVGLIKMAGIFELDAEVTATQDADSVDADDNMVMIKLI